MAFDLEGARNAGYSNTEIAEHLAAKSKFKLNDARKAGYSDDAIVAHLLGSPTAAPATPDPTAERYRPGFAEASPNAPEQDAIPKARILTELEQFQPSSPMQFAKNLFGGLAAGGAPIVSIATGESPEEQQQRLAAITDVTGAKPNRPEYATGQFLTQMGALTGVGEVLGGAAALAKAPELAAAIRTGGFGSGLTKRQRFVGGAALGAPAGAMMAPTDPITGAAAGSALGGTVGLVVPAAATGVMGVVNALSAKGVQDVANKIYLRAFGNDPVNLQKAIDMASNGATAEQIAVATNNPVFAQLVNQAKSATTEVNQLARNQYTAEQEMLANRLAGAEGVVAPLSRQAQLAAETSGTALPKVAPSQPGQVIAAEAQAEKKLVRDTLIKPAYRAAFKLAGSKPNIPVSGLISDFEAMAGAPLAKWQPSEMPSQVGTALRSFIPEKVSTAFPGQIGANPKFSFRAVEPKATLEQIDGLRSAINAETRAAIEKADVNRERILNQMHETIDTAVAGSEMSQVAKDAYARAISLYRDKFKPRFKTGDQVTLLDVTRRNQPGILPEDVITKFIQPGGEAAAQNLVNMIGNNPNAKTAVADGVKELFRQSVVKNGAIDAKAVDKFMTDYELPLATLEKAGIKVKTGLELTKLPATVFPATAEGLAAQSQTIAKLQSKVDADPTNPAAIKTLNDAQTAINEVTAALKDQKKFAKLVQFGSGVPDTGISIGAKGPIKIPVGITAEILYNNINRFLRERVEGKLADQIGRELLDSGAIARALQNARDANLAATAAKKTSSGVPAILNALTATSNTNQLGAP
jgi:hypothetical protein